MDLREYLRILRTRWLLIAFMTVLATPQYEAQAKLYVSARIDSQASGDLLQGSNFARQNMTAMLPSKSAEARRYGAYGYTHSQDHAKACGWLITLRRSSGPDS